MLMSSLISELFPSATAMRWFKVDILAFVAAFSNSVLGGSNCSRAAASISTLQGLLSNSTLIYLPGTPEFIAASARWSVLDAPTPNIVVVPGTENDVVLTVNFPPISTRNANKVHMEISVAPR